ncbi:GD12004 [Drosophila simulans]|uniref:GD12004 n=1 Tax=Drosophila simulans TaxID=7240 RepID=B4NRU2_DROSI|nr:GD12004 [Drosophila simulans]
MAVDMDMEAIKALTSSQDVTNQSDSNWKPDGRAKALFSQKCSVSEKKVTGAGCGHLLPSLSAALCLLIFQVGLAPAVSARSPANETAWPPMRHYDIWDDHLGEPGGLEEDSFVDEADFRLQTGTPEELDMEMSLQEISDRSSRQANSRQGKVIHLFPVPVDGYCMSSDGRRIGNCLNAYECRQKDGQAKGECAMGFGVCCVFLASCNTTITNNVTYIVSPEFPSFMPSNFTGCSLRVKMMSDEISQVRIDFHHFTLGHPNRRTGVCEGDVFSIGGGPGGNFSLCGQNSGQHLYYDVGARSSPRQSTLYGSLRPVDASTGPSNSTPTGDRFIDISLSLSSRLLPLRIWEMSVVQIPFSQRAPAGCLQYLTGTEGIMQTFNFAENGRHLANQNYRICVRQELDMCSIMYQPCDEQSFRIGGGGRMASRGGGTSEAAATTATSSSAPAQSDAAGATAATLGNAAVTTTAPTSSTLMQMLANMANSTTTTLMTMMSGNSTQAASSVSSGSTSSSSTAAMSTTTTSTTPTPLRSSTEASTTSAAPASSPASDDVEGSGGEVGDDEDDDGGFLFFRSRPTTERSPVSRRPRPSGGFDIMGIIRNAIDLPLKWRRRQARQFFSTCSDRITMPCIIEDFIGTGLGPLPGCEPVHCGAQFCSSGVWPCRIESTVTPFYIGVHFGNGQGAGKANAEDNVGACLRYSQVQCM